MNIFSYWRHWGTTIDWYVTGQMITVALCDSGLWWRKRTVSQSYPESTTRRSHARKTKVPWHGVARCQTIRGIFCHKRFLAHLWFAWVERRVYVCTMPVLVKLWRVQKVGGILSQHPNPHDSAERGCHMIIEYMKKVRSEEARQDLLQCVQFWRSIMPDLSKEFYFINQIDLCDILNVSFTFNDIFTKWI